MNRILSVFGPAVALLMFGSCTRQSGEEEAAGVKPLVAVRSAEVTVGDAAQTVAATGHTEALRREKITSPVAGTITSLDLLEGSPVREGQVLVTILTKESQAAIAGAEVLVRSARTERQKAEADRALAIARATANGVPISAPFRGVVAARNVNRGEIVAENAELMTILDPTSIVFVADFPLADIDRIREGMAGTVRLVSMPEHPYACRVDVILPQGDAQSQTARVRCRFHGRERAGEVRPDIAGTIEVITGIRRHAMLVPKQALLRDDETNAYSVVTITSDSLSLVIPVEVGARNDSTVEVISPRLREGMPVITEGQYMLADSTRVTLGPGDSR